MGIFICPMALTINYFRIKAPKVIRRLAPSFMILSGPLGLGNFVALSQLAAIGKKLDPVVDFGIELRSSTLCDAKIHYWVDFFGGFANIECIVNKRF